MDNSTTPSTGPAPTGPANAGGPTASEASTTTTTITQQREGESDDVEVLPLTLHARASVTWDENVIDNEGLGRKKSKRCCIFHKQRPFGESSTDSSDYDSDGSSSSSSGGPSSSRNGGRRSGKKKGGGEKKIARPKQKGQVPDYQRFHA